jgi:hypothetical protein
MVEMTMQYAKESGINRIQLTIPPMIYLTKYSNYIDFALIKNGFDYVKRDVSSVVQLDVPREKLLYTYRSEARTAVKNRLSRVLKLLNAKSLRNIMRYLRRTLK